MGRYSGRSCRLICMLCLTSVFFVTELVSGYVGNSLALVADSFNMLSDALSLTSGLASARLARWPATSRHTYGLVRGEVVSALATASFLVALSLSVAVQALKALSQPDVIDNPKLVLIVGALGLSVNLTGLMLFQDCFSCSRLCARFNAAEVTDDRKPRTGEEEMGASVKRSKENAINIRGVLLHTLGDALGSVTVVITAIVFNVRPITSKEQCNWQCYIDPALTIAMTLIIITSAVRLIREAAVILLQIVPPDILIKDIEQKLSGIPGVQSIHRLHVWRLTAGRDVASVHIKCAGMSDYATAGLHIHDLLQLEGIDDITVQPEFALPRHGDCEFPFPVADDCNERGACSVPEKDEWSAATPVTEKAGGERLGVTQNGADAQCGVHVVTRSSRL
ncbi:calcium/manganese antiporter SLC30A10-like [Lethenteron reissneri]|uniref:calcium/manganese antiporter SLC30A10-like n=1 Tax=Lethenteron reissneri TaxID=7753 RepID=UPI002AB60D96|nr:calcium/manganese antiporter SLC30A10-like [Lethenteron reissneri]